MVSAMRDFGLKSFIQVGAIFINAPGPPDGYVRSFGNTQVRILYLNDVAAIARTKPDYMVFATEINLLHRFNPAEFEKFRSLYSLAASTVKSISPQTKVGLLLPLLALVLQLRNREGGCPVDVLAAGLHRIHDISGVAGFAKGTTRASRTSRRSFQRRANRVPQCAHRVLRSRLGEQGPGHSRGTGGIRAQYPPHVLDRAP